MVCSLVVGGDEGEHRAQGEQTSKLKFRTTIAMYCIVCINRFSGRLQSLGAMVTNLYSLSG